MEVIQHTANLWFAHTQRQQQNLPTFTRMLNLAVTQIEVEMFPVIVLNSPLVENVSSFKLIKFDIC